MKHYIGSQADCSSRKLEMFAGKLSASKVVPRLRNIIVAFVRATKSFNVPH